jgi:hypothetical protein
MKNEKTAEKTDLDRKEARKAYLKRPAEMSESFLKKYGDQISHFDLATQLKIFCTYCGASTDFATTDLIRRMS